MRALVVFESMFGNTQEVAAAVAAGLREHLPVDLVEVSAAPAVLDDDVRLLVVGGPTHAFGMSRERTRADAVTKVDVPLVSTGIGVREWLGALRPGLAIDAAAFDTRVRTPRLPGSAAAGAAKRLRRLGFRLVAASESFYVSDMNGPLLDGEVRRARAWAGGLGADVAGQRSPS